MENLIRFIYQTFQLAGSETLVGTTLMEHTIFYWERNDGGRAWVKWS